MATKSAGFVGFSRGHYALNAGAGATAALVYSGEDAEVRSVSKSLGKKDGVTRVKALQALGHLVGARPATVREVLPFFLFHLSSKFLQDNALRVRAGAAQAIRALLDANKHALARGLPRLLGPWLLLATDPAPEVRSVALSALEQAFGDDLGAVLERYALPVLRFLARQLRLRQDDLTDAGGGGAAASEVAEERYVRLRLATLRAVRLLVARLGPERGLRVLRCVPRRHATEVTGAREAGRDPDPRLEEALSLVFGPMLWDSLEAPAPLLRRAAYEVVIEVAQQLPGALAPDTEGAEALPEMLMRCALAEAPAQPNCVGLAWKALIVYLQRALPAPMPRALAHRLRFRTVLKKQVVPKIRSAFNGDAVDIAPFVLPLLAALPVEVEVEAPAEPDEDYADPAEASPAPSPAGSPGPAGPDAAASYPSTELDEALLAAEAAVPAALLQGASQGVSGDGPASAAQRAAMVAAAAECATFVFRRIHSLPQAANIDADGLLPTASLAIAGLFGSAEEAKGFSAAARRDAAAVGRAELEESLRQPTRGPRQRRNWVVLSGLGNALHFLEKAAVGPSASEAAERLLTGLDDALACDPCLLGAAGLAVYSRRSPGGPLEMLLRRSLGTGLAALDAGSLPNMVALLQTGLEVMSPRELVDLVDDGHSADGTVLPLLERLGRVPDPELELLPSMAALAGSFANARLAELLAADAASPDLSPVRKLLQQSLAFLLGHSNGASVKESLRVLTAVLPRLRLRRSTPLVSYEAAPAALQSGTVYSLEVENVMRRGLADADPVAFAAAFVALRRADFPLSRGLLDDIAAFLLDQEDGRAEAWEPVGLALLSNLASPPRTSEVEHAVHPVWLTPVPPPNEGKAGLRRQVCDLFMWALDAFPPTKENSNRGGAFTAAWRELHLDERRTICDTAGSAARFTDEPIPQKGVSFADVEQRQGAVPVLLRLAYGARVPLEAKFLLEVLLDAAGLGPNDASNAAARGDFGVQRRLGDAIRTLAELGPEAGKDLVEYLGDRAGEVLWDLAAAEFRQLVDAAGSLDHAASARLRCLGASGSGLCAAEVEAELFGDAAARGILSGLYAEQLWGLEVLAWVPERTGEQVERLLAAGLQRLAGGGDEWSQLGVLRRVLQQWVRYPADEAAEATAVPFGFAGTSASATDLEKGMDVLYGKHSATSGLRLRSATVIGKHIEVGADEDPYFTLRLDDGNEVQTVAENLFVHAPASLSFPVACRADAVPLNRVAPALVAGLQGIATAAEARFDALARQPDASGSRSSISACAVGILLRRLRVAPDASGASQCRDLADRWRPRILRSLRSGSVDPEAVGAALRAYGAALLPGDAHVSEVLRAIELSLSAQPALAAPAMGLVLDVCRQPLSAALQRQVFGLVEVACSQRLDGAKEIATVVIAATAALFLETYTLHAASFPHLVGASLRRRTAASSPPALAAAGALAALALRCLAVDGVGGADPCSILGARALSHLAGDGIYDGAFWMTALGGGDADESTQDERRGELFRCLLQGGDAEGFGAARAPALVLRLPLLHVFSTLLSSGLLARTRADEADAELVLRIYGPASPEQYSLDAAGSLVLPPTIIGSPSPDDVDALAAAADVEEALAEMNRSLVCLASLPRELRPLLDPETFLSYFTVDPDDPVPFLLLLDALAAARGDKAGFQKLLDASRPEQETDGGANLLSRSMITAFGILEHNSHQPRAQQERVPPMEALRTGSVRPALELALDDADEGGAALALGSRGDLIEWARDLDDPLHPRQPRLAHAAAALAAFRTARILPARLSGWWTKDCPRRLSGFVLRFMEAELSGAIAAEEMDVLREGLAEDQGEETALAVRCSAVSRAVTITYEHEDCTADVVITLPPGYPLVNVEVSSESRLGLPETQWRRWTLQIVTLLALRDGTIRDAVALWKRNLDKAFEGVEPCPICFSTLHFKTNTLPNVQCGTCRHRFHGSCLYKWFSTSHNSSCPMCRSVGNFEKK